MSIEELVQKELYRELRGSPVDPLETLGDRAWYGFDKDKLQVRMEHENLVKYAAEHGVPVDKWARHCTFNGFRWVRSAGQSMMETAYQQGWKDLAAAFIWLPKDIAGPLYEPQEN